MPRKVNNSNNYIAINSVSNKKKRINVLDTLNTIDISFNNKLDIHPLRYLINETGRIDYLIRNSNGSSYVNYFNNIKFENGYIFDNKDQLFNFIYDIDKWFKTFVITQ